MPFLNPSSFGVAIVHKLLKFENREHQPYELLGFMVAELRPTTASCGLSQVRDRRTECQFTQIGGTESEDQAGWTKPAKWNCTLRLAVDTTGQEELGFGTKAKTKRKFRLETLPSRASSNSDRSAKQNTVEKGL